MIFDIRFSPNGVYLDKNSDLYFHLKTNFESYSVKCKEAKWLEPFVVKDIYVTENHLKKQDLTFTKKRGKLCLSPSNANIDFYVVFGVFLEENSCSCVIL